MAKYHLTARTGSEAQRLPHESLEEALTMMEDWVKMVIADGPLDSVSAIREYGPDRRVKSRIQVAESKIFGGAVAGIDVMGDLRCVPFRGSIKREPIAPVGNESPFEAVRRYFAESGAS